jgi:hypothetical protein
MADRLKFDECRVCVNKRTWRCVRCTAGEFFEEEDLVVGDDDTDPDIDPDIRDFTRINRDDD